MLYQKVRPTTLAEIAGNVSLKEGLLQVFEKKEKPHSFLFYGPSGCGKTTIARILATNLGCVDASIFEYNAANTRGIETIRKLIEEVYLMPLFGTQKAYILDESHQLTDTAQQALLKVLEDCPSYCYFFLCTTDPARLIDTIRNRCTKYQVGYLGQFEMQRLLEEVVKREKIDISEDVLLAVVVTSEGCPRAALVALEMVAGITDIDKAISLLTSGSTEDPTIIDLCNYLLKQPQLREASWKAALEVFSRVDNDSEAVRRSILKVLYNRLIGCSNREDAKDYSRLMQIFSRSTFYGGKYQLAALVAEACLARNNNA